MNKTTVLGIIIVVIVVVLGAWTLYSTNTTAPVAVVSPQISPEMNPLAPSTALTPTTESSPIGSPVVPTPSSQKIFNVSGKDFSFSPSKMTVKKGDYVKIVFTSTDGYHDLKIDELGVATKRINNGQSDTVEFAASKAGTFQFYCSVGSHRAMGMVGTFTVTP